MYRIKVIIDTSAEKLIAAFENSDDITKWNTTLSKHQILKKFDNTNATISYQVTRVPKPFHIYFFNFKKKLIIILLTGSSNQFRNYEFCLFFHSIYFFRSGQSDY